MCLHLHAHQYWKAIKVKFQKQYLIHKEQKFYQQDLIKQPDYGMFNHPNVYKYCKDIRTKYFHVCSTMKGILLLQDQKITHVKYGEIAIHGKLKTKRKKKLDCLIENRRFILFVKNDEIDN